MIAASMESKRIGMSHKTMFVVPNNLTGQWAADVMRLYPAANVLMVTKKDFTPANRKKYCARIATGEYDAIILGHSQFEKIPLSKERQAAFLQDQVNELTAEIGTIKQLNGERFTIKQMEKFKKSLSERLTKLHDERRKDNVVTFEELGVDRLYIDEAHHYKNLMLQTKMRNVAGLSLSAAQKSSDLFAKCRYLDELTGGKGVIFATGTPISNSMTELYTMQRYLQYETLRSRGLLHFDAWASTFGETVVSVELAPEGTGYRPKTRFAKFFNLPELMTLFKEIADIKTADMLNLPVPEVEYTDVVLPASDRQKHMIEELATRAEAVRDGLVLPHEDNMLKITTDGRKLALDARLMPGLEKDVETGKEEPGKADACACEAYDIWKETSAQRATQLIFCDLSTPKFDGAFNLYDDIKMKLIARGVPEKEIAYIHEANTETKKQELYAKVRSGTIRFLFGSTTKMGAGMNVQDRLIALHHLEVPWKPSDIEQREGRAVRRDNMNPKVKIFRYITESTFDAYSWQLIESKQKFVGQIMTSKSPVRSCDDIDESALTYAEVKALATGNPYIKEKMDLDVQVSRLKLLKSNHQSQKHRIEDDILKRYPAEIARLKRTIAGLEKDQAAYAQNKLPEGQFHMTVDGKRYDEKKEAGAAIIECVSLVRNTEEAVQIGIYCNFPLYIKKGVLYKEYVLTIQGALKHSVEIGADPRGNLTRIDNLLESFSNSLSSTKAQLSRAYEQMESAKQEVKKPFLQDEELQEKLSRLQELNMLLDAGNGRKAEVGNEQIQMPGISFEPHPCSAKKEGIGANTHELEYEQ